jgi:hypothetical protein
VRAARELRPPIGLLSAKRPIARASARGAPGPTTGPTGCPNGQPPMPEGAGPGTGGARRCLPDRSLAARSARASAAHRLSSLEPGRALPRDERACRARCPPSGPDAAQCVSRPRSEPTQGTADAPFNRRPQGRSAQSDRTTFRAVS